MSEIYFFKNKLDQLLRDHQADFEKNKLVGLIELLKKMALTIDDEIEQLKKKQKLSEF